MSDTTPTASASANYHYVVTVQLPNGAVASSSGVVSVALPSTRLDLYSWILDKIRKEHGVRDGDRFAVLFFDAMPNDLPGGA